MPNPIIKQFVVEGATGFPLEMLHTNQCWPARAADAVAIAKSQAAPQPAKINLASAAKYTPNRLG